MKQTENNIEKLRKEIEERTSQSPIFNIGLKTMLNTYLENLDIDNAKRMFSCHQDDAYEAISQFKPEKHDINNRPDKKRVDQDDYPTCKLTCAIQRRTNSVSTHFMFGNKIKFTLGNKPEESKELQPYFDMFLEYIDKHYFHEKMYEARQITGSETECAKLYSLYKDEDGNTEVICQLKSNSKGDTLYSLFNQYGKMVAFAIGYHLRNSEFKSEEYFDVYTSDTIWSFKKGSTMHKKGWELVSKKQNDFHKIPIIYYHHEVDWDGAQPNIDRLEWVTSKNGDTNEYFGNPYLLISPDVADNRLADAREVGKVITVETDGKFEFVAPPDCGDMIMNEKNDLNASIERDTLTPDWTYKSIMGLGTLSAKAMRQINISGYVKRDRLAIKVYNELIRRDINLILAIMCNYEYLGKSDIADNLNKLKINFSYTDPFVGNLDDNSTEVATFVGANAMSIHSAVMANHYIEDKEAEEERIWKDIERKAIIEAKAKASVNPVQTEDENNDEGKNKTNQEE